MSGHRPSKDELFEELRRVRTLIRRSFAGAVPPDWSGFWAGVARGIEDHGIELIQLAG